MDIVTESFINQVKNFIRDLRHLYPKDKIFSVAEYSVKMYALSNPRELVDTFKQYLEKYRTEIQNKDESFFLTTEYEFNDSSYTDNIINQLRTKWSVLDSENKKSIWLYLKVLLKLADKCT